MRRSTRSLLLLLVLLFGVAGTTTVGALTALSPTSAAAEDEAGNFDPVQWFMCYWGEDSIPAKQYEATQTDSFHYEWRSKSVITSGLDPVDGFNNWFLDLTGGNFKERNETLMGHPLQKVGDTAAAPADEAAPGSFNKGVALNPFDRFGVAGMKFTGYQGEWKYIVVHPCKKGGEAIDPKVGLMYENRLMPQSVWEDRNNSLDPRSEQHSRGFMSHFGTSFGNTVANFFFGFTKFVVTLTYGLISMAFSDIVSLMGLNDLIGGTAEKTGIFKQLYDGVFTPLIFLAFAMTGVSILWKGIAKKQYRESLSVLARSLAMFVAAVIIAAKPLLFIALPNNVAVVVQSLMIASMNTGLAGGGGLCATDVGATTTQIAETSSTDPQEAVSLVAQASENMRSAVGCSFWQQFLLKPWSQGQWGEDWNRLWDSQDSIPSWAPKGSAFIKTDDSGSDGAKADEKIRAMTGDASVPLGADTVLHNWALFQLSTQTNAHVPLSKEGKLPETASYSKYTNGVANDWWRIVDRLSNYREEEKTKEVQAGSQAASQAVSQQPSSPPGSSSVPVPAGMKAWPTNTKAMAGNYPGHSGVDFLTPVGSPIFAAADGIVRPPVAGMVGYGTTVWVKFNDGTEAVYAHLSRGVVTVGTVVKAGDILGYTGNTGNSQGPHLHFEVVPQGHPFGNPHVENRIFTLKWLGGDVVVPQAPSDSSGTGGLDTSGSETITVTYNVPVENIHVSPLWDTWTGNSIWQRMNVAFSSGFVAVVGVAAPLFFAVLSAMYAFGVALLTAFAPVFLLMACWSGKGWEAFKGWAQLVVDATVKRIVLGMLLVLSITFSAAAINIMEQESWWEGMLIMALLSVVIIRSRKKMYDMFSGMKFAAGTFSGGNEKFKKTTGRMKKGVTAPLNLAAKSAAGGIAGGVVAARNEGSIVKGFKAGASSGARAELRNLSYRNKLVRSAMHTYDFTLQNQNRENDANAFVNKKDNRCYRCGETLAENELAGISAEGDLYCYQCAEETSWEGLTEFSLESFKMEEERRDVTPTKLQSVYQSYENEGKAARLFEDPDLEAGDVEGKAIPQQFVDFAALIGADIAAHEVAKLRGKKVTAPAVPEELRRYLDQELIQEAWNSPDPRYDYIRNSYAKAWTLWAIEHFREEMGDKLAGLVNDISATSVAVQEKAFEERLGANTTDDETPSSDEDEESGTN